MPTTTTTTLNAGGIAAAWPAASAGAALLLPGAADRARGDDDGLHGSLLPHNPGEAGRHAVWPRVLGPGLQSCLPADV